MRRAIDSQLTSTTALIHPLQTDSSTSKDGLHRFSEFLNYQTNWHYWLQQKLPEVLTMSSNQQFLQNLYEAFNKRELEAIISVMHPDVKWANGVEGGFVYGRDAVREYWTNQYEVLSNMEHLDDWSKLIFMLTGDIRLGNKTPLECLRNAQKGEVISAARAYGLQYPA